MIRLVEIKKSIVTILFGSMTEINLVYSALDYYLDVLYEDMEDEELNKDEVFSVETLLRELYEQEMNSSNQGIEVIISSLELSPLVYALTMYEGVLNNLEDEDGLRSLYSLKDQVQNALIAYDSEIADFYLLSSDNRYSVLKDFEKKPFGSVVRGFKSSQKIS